MHDGSFRNRWSALDSTCSSWVYGGYHPCSGTRARALRAVQVTPTHFRVPHVRAISRAATVTSSLAGLSGLAFEAESAFTCGKQQEHPQYSRKRKADLTHD